MSAMVILWALVCAGGFTMLWRYKARPGDPGDAATRWPATSALVRSPSAPTLVMIAHPRCTCTRASLGELAEVMRDAPADVAAYVVFDLPDGADPGWEHGELYAQARAIAGVQVVLDRGGVEAARFGAAVSGHVLIYEPAGALRFSGGITGARGHAGDNVGRARVATLLAGHAADHDRSHVYGCALETPP